MQKWPPRANLNGTLRFSGIPGAGVLKGGGGGHLLFCEKPSWPLGYSKDGPTSRWPKMAQGGGKLSPRWHPNSLAGLQDGVQIAWVAPVGFRWSSEVFKVAKDTQDSPQDGLSCAKDGPKQTTKC